MRFGLWSVILRGGKAIPATEEAVRERYERQVACDVGPGHRCGCCHRLWWWLGPDCRQSGGAEVCLDEDRQASRLTGKGFQADSEVRASVEGDAPPADAQGLPPLRTSADGALPRSGEELMVLKGPVPQRLTVLGTAAGGAPVTFQFTIPAQSS